MATRDRNIQKQRGSRTHGYGSRQKHRGAGSRGGRGMAGSAKHKWTYVSKYLPGYLGKKGFTSHVPRKEEITINVEDIGRNLDSWTEEKLVKKSGKMIRIDLGAMGYTKLLGSGKTDMALEIIVPRFSQRALEKIKAAGGVIEGALDEGNKGEEEIIEEKVPDNPIEENDSGE